MLDIESELHRRVMVEQKYTPDLWAPDDLPMSNPLLEAFNLRKNCLGCFHDTSFEQSWGSLPNRLAPKVLLSQFFFVCVVVGPIAFLFASFCSSVSWVISLS